MFDNRDFYGGSAENAPSTNLKLGIAALVLVVAIGLVVDLLFVRPSAEQDDPGAQGAPIEQEAPGPSQGEDEGGDQTEQEGQPEDQPQGQEGDPDALTLSGISLEPAERLGALDDAQREDLARALVAYNSLRGVEGVTRVEVTRDSEVDQQSVRSWLDVAGEEVAFVWDGTWQVTDSLGTISFSLGGAEGADPVAPGPVGIDDAEGLSEALGTEAAVALPTAWAQYAQSIGLDGQDATVDPATARPTQDGTQLEFEIACADRTFACRYALDGSQFAFAERQQ